MKSLQIVVPFQTCPFRCPFCIANNPKVETAFVNLYESDKNMYFRLLATVLNENPNLKTVVLTGDTEPTLNMPWLIEVAQFIASHNRSIKIELQTKNTNTQTIETLLKKTKIDVYGFSVDTESQFYQALRTGLDYFTNPQVAEKRLTLLLNSKLNLDKINAHGFFSQVTIKYLQKGDNPKINKWVDEHRFTDMDSLKRFIKRHSTLSVMVDENCMASEGRYSIFRSDGFLYKTWTDLPK